MITNDIDSPISIHFIPKYLDPTKTSGISKKTDFTIFKTIEYFAFQITLKTEFPKNITALNAKNIAMNVL